MTIPIFGCSLNAESRSRILAREATTYLQSRGHTSPLVDLREYRLPLCDGECTDPVIDALEGIIRPADAILLAVPIYNYYGNAAAKNLIEHTGSAWEDKIVGFLCAAGGHGSYMSVMSLANSLILDFRCLIVPRFVYAVGSDFSGEAIASAKIQDRVRGLCDQTAKLAAALRGA
jgi:FMN reductase